MSAVALAAGDIIVAALDAVTTGATTLALAIAGGVVTESSTTTEIVPTEAVETPIAST
jgi:hypothetical protein